MNILIINGPNLNFLGIREPDIYGNQTYEDLEKTLQDFCLEHDMTCDIKQTNFEGIIIDLLQYAHRQKLDGIILNAAAFTHYSYSLYDAIKSIDIPVVEVHLTDITKRKEPFRQLSVIKDACVTTFSGKGFDSYKEALMFFIKGEQS